MTLRGDQRVGPRKWAIVSRHGAVTVRDPRRFRLFATIEAAILKWRFPQCDVTVEQNQ